MGRRRRRWRRPVLAAIVLVGAWQACRHDRALDGLRKGEGQEGQASWYGPGFDGRKTANGERYDMHGRSAAHRTLPFGTRIRVTRVDNGESIAVRVNDRGPFVRGRIVDLSLGAAKAIGLDRDGVARVVLTVEEWPDGDVAAIYTVQVGAFKEVANARRLRDTLSARWDDVHVHAWYEFHRVRVGMFATESMADEAGEKLSEEGFTPFVTREN